MFAASLTLGRKRYDALARRDLSAAVARFHPDVETPAMQGALASR